MHRVFVLLVGVSLSWTAFAQDAVRIDSGSLEGVPYRILFPDNWQNKLVMFAHGIELPGSPSSMLQPGFVQTARVYLDRGFAVAASAYSCQGYALPQGVDETEALRQYFWKTYGIPDSTYMAGMSMGGGVSLAMMENYSDPYNGALALCPLSSRPYMQTRKEFEAFVLFDALFPGVLGPLSELLDIDSDYREPGFAEMGARANAMNQAMSGDSLRALELARWLQVRTTEIPFLLLFGEGVIRDIILKAGGNPFDNTNTIYSGFSDDWELNKKVQRFRATADPGQLFGKYDRTGNIGKPVVLMHTIHDPLIPPSYGEVNFENMVYLQGKGHLLTVKMCNGMGHCIFTPEQIGRAFDELRQWVSTGEKAKPGMLE
jgi:pimeloyl-ACP methyl ester carboxylesterase